MDKTTDAVNPTEILYRLKGVNGELLYVGITRDWPTRMTQHQREKPWWSEVLNVEMVRIGGTRTQVEAIEKAVIKAESPIYNVVHNGRKLSAPTSRVEEQFHGAWGAVRRLTDDIHYPLNKHLRLGDMVAHTVFGEGEVIDIYSEAGKPIAAIQPTGDPCSLVLVDVLYTRLDLLNTSPRTSRKSAQ